ncbi:hypothetical protein [Marivirga arenosa]|uniref:Uncharacterized protein n=1 Tax=Marivirga arenosa TaxID=3059076 RepID=A0AA51ZVP8_9BACT|nr:hypothetical protein [Marivirga sp. BKB1-2]WNB17609.1 hypothetical protein QYS47_34455 [Marivirga sp. BKB1-2]
MTTIFLLFTITVFGQTDGITEIKKLYNETQDNKSTYKTLTADDFENSSEGGELKAFKDSQEVRLIEARYYGHMGKTVAEFYYLNGQIYFIFLKEFRYNMPPTESGYDQDKTTIEESRYYFWDNRMIRWISPDGEYVDTKSPEFLKTSKENYDWADELLETVK